MSHTLPPWLEAAEPESWPTLPIEQPQAGYRLRLRQGWSTEPVISAAGPVVTHVYRGGYASEWLRLSHLTGAEPDTPLENWVDGLLAVAGLPVEPGLYPGQPELLAWHNEGHPATVAARLAVDEVALYQGVLGLWQAQPPEMARLYILLARRERRAWNVALSFMTACPPGTAAEKVARNDHRRAGATFDHLAFF